MWRRVNAAAWRCDFLTSSSVYLLQQSLIIPFSLAGACSLHRPPVCSAESGPPVRMDGGSRRAGRDEGGCGRIPPEASSTSGGESESERNTSTCSSIPPPPLSLSRGYSHASPTSPQMCSQKSLWLWRRREGAHALGFFFILILFLSQEL